jgi:hypothetical protein
VGSLAQRPKDNLEDRELHFIWPLSFDLSDMGSTTRSLRSRQHLSSGHWALKTPLHYRR